MEDAAHMSSEPARSETVMMPHADVRRIIMGLMLGMLLAALDMTIVGPTLPTIGHELGRFDLLPWVVTSYLLVSTAVTPLYGKLADIHGRRVMLLLALGLFIIGSIACAISPNMLTLIFARGLQGLGGGGIMSLTQTIIGDIVAPRERVKYQVYLATVWVVSNIAGPVLGGYFAQRLHWSMIFWINLPIGLAAWLITSKRLKAIPRHERPHKLDLIGAFLMMSASTMLLMALNWGGTHAPWLSPLILGLFAGSLLLFGLLVARLLTAEEPLIPLTVLKNKVVSRGMLAMFFAMGSYVSMTIYVPIYLQDVLGLDIGTSGLAMVPLMMGTTVGAMIGTKCMPYFKRYLRIPVVFMLLSALSCVPLALMPGNLTFVQVEILLFLAAVGIGPVFPLVNVAIQSAVPLHELGTTTALVTFMRSLGASLEVAVIGTIVVAGIASVGLSIESGVSAVSAATSHALAPTFGMVFAVTGASFGLSFLWLMSVVEPPLLDHRQSSAQPNTRPNDGAEPASAAAE